MNLILIADWVRGDSRSAALVLSRVLSPLPLQTYVDNLGFIMYSILIALLTWNPIRPSPPMSIQSAKASEPTNSVSSMARR
jgi:hypothetical protein